MLKEDLKNIKTEQLIETKQISVRAAKLCLSIGLDTLFDIVLFFEKNGSFFNILLDIRHVGLKSSEELDKLCAKIIPTLEVEKEKKYCKNVEIIQIIRDLSEQEREMLQSFANLIINSEKLVKEKIRKFRDYWLIDNYLIEFYERYGHLPMFWILEQYLKKDSAREIKILSGTFHIFQNKQPQTLEDVANKHCLTRERVRQIRNVTFYQTFEITDEVIAYKKDSNLIKYAELLQNKDDWDYILFFLHGTESISQKSLEIQELLKKERCNLSIVFVLQIIANIFRDTFSLFGGFEISNRDRIFENTILIRKEYTDIFDFKKFIEEFAKYIAYNETEYLLDIENYISNSQCWLKYDFDKLNNIINIIRDVLLYEFYLYSEDIDGKIKIPATMQRNPSDVVYEILKIKGQSMHLNEIFVEFKKMMPEHKYTYEDNPERLRPYLQKHDNITFRKRNSIYTLKEWEHIRTGTIRGAIIEFLFKNDLPQTVETITEYVLQYFPETNQKNIHSTMFSGKNFIQFKYGFFGLVNKKYSSEYEILEREEPRKTFEKRLTDLEKFIVENEHFPFSSSENKDEESLFRWWYRVVSGKQTITEIQQAEVERIIENYADFELDKDVYEWNLNYNKFKIFILENRRVPSAGGEEKFLHGWLRRAKDDFLNYRLSEEQRKRYIELAKLI